MSPRDRRLAGKSQYVAFLDTSASVPVIAGFESAARATWATDGKNGLRLRVGDTGEYALSYKSHTRRTVATGTVQQILNRSLRGRYPIASVEGPYIYIDLGTTPVDLATD